MNPIRIRYLRRYNEIINVIIKHGFGYIFEELGIDRMLNLPGRIFRRKDARLLHYSKWERIRMILEELGPTFVKIGQILSVRPDLVPNELIIELSKLQDRVPPTNFEQIKSLLESELGRPAAEFFDEVEEKPLAAASIAQIHRAVLKDSTAVVLKLQRPGVEKTVKTDLEILTLAAGMINQRSQLARLYNFTGIVDEFKGIITDEMDFIQEAQNIEAFTYNFRDDNTVRLPKVYEGFNTKRLLVLEYLKGCKVTDTGCLPELGINREIVARNLIDGIMKQIFIYGLFHADPHPGNILIMPENVVAFLDFGMVGRLDHDNRLKFVNLVLAVVGRDAKKVSKALLEMDVMEEIYDTSRLQRDIEKIISRYAYTSLHKLNIGEITTSVMNVAYKYSIHIPVDFVVLAKTMVTTEGIVKKLCPEINLMDAIEPFGRELVKERYSVKNIMQTFTDTLAEQKDIWLRLPKRLDNLAAGIEKGDTSLKVSFSEFNKLLINAKYAVNRLSISIIVASSIIGTALMVRGNPQSILWKVPLAEFGFAVAFILGIWLMISIIRTGRI